MTAPQTVTFYFDPACPWTWRTSRWLDDVTGRAGVSMKFAAFELSDAAPLDRVPEQYRAGATASRGFLRAVTKAHDDGHDPIIASAYTFYGTSIHDDNTAPSLDLVREAWIRADGQSYISALDDDSIDASMAASRARGAELAGDDVGSPILAFDLDGTTRGFFGPVIAPTPTGADADRLWDAVLAAVTVPQFFEFKTRRTNSP